VGKRNKELPILENIEIVDVGTEGRSVARVDNMVVFTQHVVPGDIVDIRVTRKKSNFMEGNVIKIHKFSDMRAEPACEHYGVCGGCKWQNLPYEQQLVYKRRHVKNVLKRIGHLEIPRVAPIIGSEDIYYYRNKMEYSFCNNRWITDEEMKSGVEIMDRRAAGFNIQGRFDRVLDVKKCHLQAEPTNLIRETIKKYCIDNNIAFFDLVKQDGYIRSVYVRNSTLGELMVIIVVNYDHKETIDGLCNHLLSKVPEITSLNYCINSKQNSTISDLEVITFSGKNHMMEEMEYLKYKISPKSFYQTNSKQAYNLYKATRECAGLTGNEVVYDLYTGTGTIANFVAKMAKKVVGIEYVEDAIVDAKHNAELNGLTNTLFFAGDMKDILTADFVIQHGKPDVIITDPPRSGMHFEVVKTIVDIAPEKVVYVSCNPATQARDLQVMAEKYDIVRVQPVDMFPQTAHVENIVLLQLKK
jgi:23S rRNA (uracil1939-C5)-methyltransferase